MKTIAIAGFLGGLLLGVRVMFFGVRRQLGADRLAHRVWPLALAVFLVIGGAMLYVRAAGGGVVTPGWILIVVLMGVAVGVLVWSLVRRSALKPSTDPEDDPRYRFQGHVARIIQPIGTSSDGFGRIAFDIDGQVHELRARWSPSAEMERAAIAGDSEVVIERVEDDIAFVEPWTEVEQRL